jgi:hypothetical protein
MATVDRREIMNPVITGNRLIIEESLLQGLIWIAMRNGRWWRCHKNGPSQWHKDYPGVFSIPVIAGARAKIKITQKSKILYVDDRYAYTAPFLWCEENPLIQIGKARP